MGSGVADYSFELLPFIAAHAEVDVFCPPPRVGSVRAPSGIRVREPEQFFRSGEAFDGVFFHLANNPAHEFVYRAALRAGGTVVFHETTLHHLIGDITIEGRGDADGYANVLREEYGERGERLARLRERGVATDFEKFLFPLTSHVARHANGIVVHSRDAGARISASAGGVPVTVIPHHAGRPPDSLEGVTREEARARLGLPSDAFIVGHFGFVARPKQPAAVLGGFAALHREVPSSVLVFVGADRTGGALDAMARDLEVAEAMRTTGFVDLERLYLYLRAVDAVVSLRYPSAGESSGILARALAEGRALVVNNYGSWTEVPPDAALRVEIDGPQSEQVGAHLLRLAQDPHLKGSLEQAAQTYAGRNLDPLACSHQYVSLNGAGRPGGSQSDA
jgi:glycosyltransferase involved in cell wall biosynthesis